MAIGKSGRFEALRMADSVQQAYPGARASYSRASIKVRSGTQADYVPRGLRNSVGALSGDDGKASALYNAKLRLNE